MMQQLYGRLLEYACLEITKDILAQETFRILLRLKLWIVSI